MAVIVATAREILQAGGWDKFCEEKGINPWAMNEGQVDGDEEFSLTIEEARRYGILKEEEQNTWYNR